MLRDIRGLLGRNDFGSPALASTVRAAATQDRRAGTLADMARKLIAFDEDTLSKLTQLGRDRMATFQELADEAFADLLRKHGIPIDLKDALRKSAARPNVVTSGGAKTRNRKAK
jgi:hypothetical protein